MFEVEVGHCVDPMKWNSGAMLMTAPNKEFALAGSLEELKAKGRLVVHGPKAHLSERLIAVRRGRSAVTGSVSWHKTLSFSILPWTKQQPRR
jgi:hypothetical protein